MITTRQSILLPALIIDGVGDNPSIRQPPLRELGFDDSLIKMIFEPFCIRVVLIIVVLIVVVLIVVVLMLGARGVVNVRRGEFWNGDLQPAARLGGGMNRLFSLGSGK